MSFKLFNQLSSEDRLLGFEEYIKTVKEVLSVKGIVRKIYFKDPKGFDNLIPKLKLDTAFLTLYLGKGATLAEREGLSYMPYLEEQKQELYILDYPEAKLRPNQLSHLYKVLESLAENGNHIIVLTNDIEIKNIVENKETN